MQNILVLKRAHDQFAASLAAAAGVARLAREPTERHCTRCRLSKVVAPVLACEQKNATSIDRLAGKRVFVDVSIFDDEKEIALWIGDQFVKRPDFGSLGFTVHSLLLNFANR